MAYTTDTCSVDTDSQVRDVLYHGDKVHAQGSLGDWKKEDIWVLVRRFNKRIFNVKTIETTPPTNLDMNIADGEELSPDKLRAHLERLYMTVVVSVFLFHRHIVRLRSWREWSRTLCFLVVYTCAGVAGMLALTLILFLMVLIMFPEARVKCFPPAPPSIVDHKGSVELTSTTSVTGAREKHKGEAVEQEAHNFVKSIGELMMSISSGRYLQDDPSDGTAPDSSQMAHDVGDAADAIDVTTDLDQTAEPVSRAVQSFQARPILHLIPNLTDNWERLQNALNPRYPFRSYRPRLALTSCLLPLLTVSYCGTWCLVMRIIGFAVGLFLFGKPVIAHCIHLMDKIYPTWRQFTYLENTILRGVPTNAQLTLTILRIGERNQMVLPPPPDKDEPVRMQASMESEMLGHIGAPNKEVHVALHPKSPTHKGGNPEKNSMHRMNRRIGEQVKSIAKGSIRALYKINKAREYLGMDTSHSFLGALDIPARDAGPVCFPARYKETKGHAYITAIATTPAISWVSEKQDVDLAWSVMIADIVEMNKVGALGLKSALVVGWALDRDLVNGLVLKTKSGGEFYISAVSMRDEMFNRLIAMGGQRWEVW